MLVSVTRVGASRQTFAKAFAVTGADPAVVHRAFLDAGLGATVEPVKGTAGLFATRTSSSWIGTRAARDAAFEQSAAVLAGLSVAVRRCGARLVPTAVAVGTAPPVLGGDLHVIEVNSAVEQEVLCNLLRTHVPTLVAMTGRGVIGPSRPPDRIGSRWLADSRSHLAPRFIASTATEHLNRVKADLRRREGVAQLERMDVAPTTGDDGAPVVVVRCLDAAVGLSGLRAQALVLAAITMHARRLIRDGRRVGHSPQLRLEQNRARAVAGGLRARFVRDVGRPGQAGMAHGRGQEECGPADDAVRAMLGELAPEFRNLEVTAEELAPFLLAVEMAGFGGREGAGESALLQSWASQGEAVLADRSLQALTDAEPGGPHLREVRARAPGTVAAILLAWRDRIDAPARRGPGKRQRGAGR